MGVFSDKYIDEIAAVYDKQLTKRNVIRLYASMTTDERRTLRIRFLEFFQEGFKDAKNFDYGHVGPRVIGISNFKTEINDFAYGLGALIGYLEHHPIIPIQDQEYANEFSKEINTLKELEEFHKYVLGKINLWKRRILAILAKIKNRQWTEGDYTYVSRFKQGPKVYEIYSGMYTHFISLIR